MTAKPCEPVAVRMGSANVPISFRWRGFDFHVDVIDRIWRQAPDRRRDQRTYRIRSRKRTFVLHHDRRIDRWILIKSPWRIRFGLVLANLMTRKTRTIANVFQHVFL